MCINARYIDNNKRSTLHYIWLRKKCEYVRVYRNTKHLPFEPRINIKGFKFMEFIMEKFPFYV